MHHTPWNEAISAAFRLGASSQKTARLPLDQTLGRVLAEDVHTPIPLPHYDSSAMDGYAVAGKPPWALKTQVFANEKVNRHKQTLELHPGEATPILTGGLIPPGTEAVLRVESAVLSEDGAVLDSSAGAPEAGKDMRRAGEELAQGSLAARAGQTITSRLLAFLAVCGFDTLPVFTAPAVSIAYTGNEVITEGLPGPGEVRDAYSVQFPAIFSALGARVESTARLHDDWQEFTAWFEKTRGSELLVLTGGSSTSEVDMLRKIIAELGGTYAFEAVSARPGHPCLMAVLPDSRVVLGLPGNPLAAHTSLYSYLPAFVAGRNGQEEPARELVALTAPVPAFRKKDDRLLPAIVSGDSAQPLLHNARSHMLSDFARANALVRVPPQGTAADEQVEMIPLVI